MQQSQWINHRLLLSNLYRSIVLRNFNRETTQCWVYFYLHQQESIKYLKQYNMMKNIYLFCLAFLVSQSLYGQDIHWSQFEYAPLNLNAAHTGLFNGDYRLVGNYRSQWFDVPVGYRTVSLTFDAHLLPYQLENDVWGVGLTFNHDQAGDGQLSLLNIMASMAYTKRITKNFL